MSKNYRLDLSVLQAGGFFTITKNCKCGNPRGAKPAPRWRHRSDTSAIARISTFQLYYQWSTQRKVYLQALSCCR